MFTFRSGGKKLGSQVWRRPAFPSAWECHVQYPGCRLCRHAPRVSRHDAAQAAPIASPGAEARTKVRSTRALAPSSQRHPTPWISCSSQPPPPPDDRVPTTPPVSLPQGFQSPLASDADSSLAGFRPVAGPLRLRVDDAFSSYQEDGSDWVDAWRTQLSCSACRHAALVSHLYADREPAPEFLEQSLRRSPGPALGSDQRSRRLTDARPLLEPWTCTRLGSACLARPPRLTVARNLYSRRCRLRHRQFPCGELPRRHPQHHCAVLPNKDTFLRATSRARRSGSLARSGYSSWAVGRPTRLAPTSRSPTSTLTTSAPSGGPSVLRCSCSSAICA